MSCLNFLNFLLKPFDLPSLFLSCLFNFYVEQKLRFASADIIFYRFKKSVPQIPSRIISRKPFFRRYAGAIILTEGIPVPSLCKSFYTPENPFSIPTFGKTTHFLL